MGNQWVVTRGKLLVCKVSVMQDIEKLATKKGVISQSVKEVLQVSSPEGQPPVQVK